MADKKLLTFSSGGWVLWVAGLMVLAVLAHRGTIIVQSILWRDGRTPSAMASNGFDLSASLIPVEKIVPSGNLRDFFRPLSQFEIASVEEAVDKSRTFRKFIANAERVVGLSLGGEQRAYPIRILAYHEIIEDTLWGVHIAVTYSPLTDSVVVFDRRLDGDNSDAVQFGYSGLLFNANLLFYDRNDDISQSSLFSQVQRRAITGPLAGRALRTYPFQLMTWQLWNERNPATTTIGGKGSYMKKKVYEKDVYSRYHYYRKFEVPYPVAPLPENPPRPLLSRMLAIYADGVWHEVFHSDFADPTAGSEAPGSEQGASKRVREVSRTIGDRQYRFSYLANPECLSFECVDPAPDLQVVHCYWFAWYAMQNQGLRPTPAG